MVWVESARLVFSSSDDEKIDRDGRKESQVMRSGGCVGRKRKQCAMSKLVLPPSTGGYSSGGCAVLKWRRYNMSKAS